VLLPGTRVVLLDDRGQIVAETSSDEHGAFTFAGVVPGTYRVRASLTDFKETVTPPLQVSAGQQARAAIDLPLAPVAESLVVTPQSAAAETSPGRPAEPVRMDDVKKYEAVSSADVQNVIALTPGAIRTQGGPIAINGGRPTQTRVQLDGMAIIDPTTGGADIDLPSDSIETVQVLPNPASGEFGRLSAGAIQFQTRPAPSQLHFTLSDFIPEPLFYHNWIAGVRDFAPRLFAGGPLVKDRVFIAESLLVQYTKPRVYGVDTPPDTWTTAKRVDSFTRVDVNVSTNQSLSVAFGLGPKQIDQLFVGHFTPAEVAPNQRTSPYLFSATERAMLGNSATVESAVTLRDTTQSVFGNGGAPMVLAPEGRSGNYYNSQTRDMETAQWKETASIAASNATGVHLFKFGSDVLLGQYSGTDVGNPIQLMRIDGTLSELMTFPAPSYQSSRGIDAALFAGDSWSIGQRVNLQPSLRLERDGVLGETHLAPRIGGSFGLTENGSTAIRAGAGRYFERTPLLVNTFTEFAPTLVTQFAADGTTPIGSPTLVTNAVAPGLQTPSSFIWNVGFDRKLNAKWTISANALERSDANVMIVQPVSTAGGEQAVLSSTGQSLYREVSVWAQFQHKAFRASASYTWATAQGDLNTLDSFYGAFRNPFIEPNQYGPTSLDVPHRIVAWGSVPAPWGLTISSVLEYRTGFPYSAVNDNQEFVGLRNSLRFPNTLNLDISVFKQVSVGTHRLKLIARMYHALNNFVPLEVQNNVTAPDFGTFYSSITPRLALDLEFVR